MTILKISYKELRRKKIKNQKLKRIQMHMN